MQQPNIGYSYNNRKYFNSVANIKQNRWIIDGLHFKDLIINYSSKNRYGI